MTAEEDTSYTKLPIEERCVHKLWKARISGYEEAIKLFGQLDEKAPEWNKFTGIVKKFVIDSNAVAQEKGLEATLVFVENSATAGRTVGDVMTGLITKCYGAPKAKTKDIAIQITLMFIEIEKQDIVIEELVKGMDHKFPKIVSTCIKAATQAIKEYGSKVLSIKPLLKKLQSILEDRDKSVRDEAKLLAIEIYSWIGPTPVKANLANLKPLQMQELEAEFEKISGDKPRATRFLRSQQEQAAKMEEVAAANGDMILEEGTDVVDDPEEHIDPVNILSQLSKDFYEKVEAKKWQERKEAVDTLEGILSKAPKLESGEYGDLVRALKKIITKDSNVIIVGIAAKCMAMLANGLKKRFETYASACIPALLEKFKEKKQNVVLPLRDAVDAIYLSMTLESIHEDILTAIDNKNPSVKAESVSFLTRCFSKCTPTILNKKYLKIFTTALIKTLNESDPTVRDNSAEALGTAWKVVSEKNILPFLTTVDAIKLAKIKEASEKAIITAKPTNIVRESKPAAVSSNFGEKKATVTINKNTVIRRTRTAVNIPSKTVANSKVKKPMSAPGGGRKPVQSKALPPIETENEICDDELDELALTFCSPEILNGMVDANWKTRLSNVQEFSQIIDQMESLTVSSQVLIKLLNKKPGIKDNNVQIQKLRLECLKKVIEKFPITSTGMNSCIQDVSSLLGDNKNGNLASQVLTTFAESTRLDLVCNAVLDYAFTVQKNPKVQIDALNWLSGAILEFGFIIEPKSVMQNVKKAVSASNPQVRLAVISLLGVMYLYMGPQLSLFFENEKPTLVQQINAEFEKHQGEAPPKPTRGKNMDGSTESIETASDDEKPSYEVNIRDIVPRVDISPQITDALINEFSDKDWKVRSDALTKLQNIVNEAKFITSELGEARKALQDRISDSNARLGSNAINLVELISKAMGSSFKIYIKGYLPGVLNALGDPKTFKCQSARQCMNTWADVCGYREFFGGDILLDALKNNSVTLRSELWTWLAEKLPLIPSKSIPADELKCLLLVLYTSLEDRNASVRSASEKAVLGFMMHLGYASMYGACEKLKPMSVKFCREKLDKERPNLPVVPIEKPKVVKSGIPAGSSVKSGGSKIPPPKAAAKANKENVIPRVSTATGKKKEEVDNGPLFQRNNLKHQRDIDEHKLKSLKWNFASPREEFVEQLREQMLTAGINKVLITNMFHSDFRYHLKAIETLSEDLNTADDSNGALISNLDLILKWMTLRFFDTNPSVLLKGLDYLQHIFDILMTQKYTLHDTEASSFVPYLVTKLGDPKDTVRSNVRAILKQIAFIFPNTKMFQYIMDGVKSKNSRQRSECLEHLATMIEDYGTSICQPSVAAACKEIAKSIGDRDNSVRTAALNCFVAAFFLHGEALFKFVGNISEKDMGLLRERLKRASKNRAVPVATVQPTIKMVVPPVHQVPDTEDIINDEYNSDEEEHNATFNVSQESNHTSSPQRYSNDSPSRSASTLSYRTGSIPTAIEHSSALRMGFRRPVSEVYDEPQVTRYALDEKFIKELEAEEISRPELKLKSYNWNTDHDEVKFRKKIQDHTQSLPDNISSSKPCVNVSPYSTATITKSPKTPPAPMLDPIQQLINQVTSQNIETSKTALTSLDKMLLRPDMRSKFLEGGKVLSLFYAIIKQFDVLSESHDIDVTVGYKNIFNLCLNLYKYQEFTLILNEQIVRDLLSKLLYLLSMKGPENSTDTQLFGRCVNSLIMNVLERSAHTPVTCALLAMLYDTVKSPQNSSTHYKELVMKCIWKIVKDFQDWGDELCYERVLAHIHRFLKEFDSKHWKKQPSDTPLRTCKTVLHTMVKIRSDKVLESLDSPEFPKDSEMVVYIHKLLRHLNSEPRPESSKRKHRTPYDELSDIFQQIGQHENTDEGIQQLHRFKIKHPNIDIEPHISKTTKYFQDYIHRKLSAIEDNLKSCLVEPNGNNDSLKPITSMPIRKPESAAASEADGFMKRLQILKMKASREETYGASNGECNGNNRLDEDSQDEDLPMLNTSRSPRK
ncbi:protein mini spindles isoform X2 [Acyrthosiphon pisum]|uniref:TOG domain-containing protein n=1 Tax=Acyrthosiphon pisum TaxID=7029 RepID=A0A8R2BB51_ACYPI|nr:protein mini spindles isoform X2 [Acyrthosiphon pisum]|eukprot:XP_008189868.1 PREDICTED: cytoskeleton-associated protein 5 isoform X2 [Acyrthosiphon pisum]